VERELRRAILDFEPRILPGSLEIGVKIDAKEMSTIAMTFEIHGELWWQPLPERFYLKTTLDLELGKFKNERWE
jgi:type VI secretion system protein ImpF